MNPPRILSLLLILTLIAILPNLAMTQGTSARDAVTAVTNQFGPRSTQWIAELRARAGVPQPAEWDVLSFDDRSPGLLYRFRSGYGRAQDMGAEQQRYPTDVPVGYFSFNQLGVDSVAAFTIAEGEARKAKMAFDSCDYLLRVREFSTEPLWRLELRDTARRIVGKIYISGGNGQVLRTIWMYYEQRSSNQPYIVDSAAPTTPSRRPELSSGLTGNPYPPREPAPGGETGIVRMPPNYPGAPTGSAGITGAPPTSAPMTPSTAPTRPSTPQPYRPVGPNGTVSGGSVADNSIPEPPAIPTPSSNSSGMRDLREEPTAQPDPNKPPIEVPSSSGGSSERIPPPPIP